MILDWYIMFIVSATLFFGAPNKSLCLSCKTPVLSILIPLNPSMRPKSSNPPLAMWQPQAASEEKDTSHSNQHTSGKKQRFGTHCSIAILEDHLEVRKYHKKFFEP